MCDGAHASHFVLSRGVDSPWAFSTVRPFAFCTSSPATPCHRFGGAGPDSGPKNTGYEPHGTFLMAKEYHALSLAPLRQAIMIQRASSAFGVWEKEGGVAHN